MHDEELLKKQLVCCFVGASPRHERYFDAREIWDLARKTELSVEAVRDYLIRFAKQGLITLGSWDWSIHRARMWNEWANVKDMFCNPQDGNGLRIVLQLAGEEYLRDLGRHAIGFVN